MNFPLLSTEKLVNRLQPPKNKIRMVLDTDTFNEIDDQFALSYALLSPERILVEAVYAAPFFNKLSKGPADGMEKSYEEIRRVLTRLNVNPDGFAFRGSTDYLCEQYVPQHSEAAMDLVHKAMLSEDGDPLYVVGIGAITNVASAILIDPRIIEKIVVVWLGGHALQWPDTKEFNLRQDILAARVLFDCGVPLVHIPCAGVASHLLTTLSEMREFVKGRGAIGDYLYEVFEKCHDDHFAYSRVIWDISTIAYLVNSDWVPTNLVASPIVTDQMTWSFDPSRHFIRYAYSIKRDPIFRDLFTKLRA